MNLLAVDQSTTSSGWCHFIGGEMLDFGVIKTPSGGLSGIAAGLWQCARIEELAKAKEVDVLAVEDVHAKEVVTCDRNGRTHKKVLNVNTLILLGSLKGMLAHFAHSCNLRLVVVTSPEVCASLGISPTTGREEKKRASRRVAAMELFGDHTRYLEVPEDAADAIAIGGIACRKLNLEARIIT